MLVVGQGRTACPPPLVELLDVLGPRLAAMASGKSYRVGVRRSLGGWCMEVSAANVPFNATRLEWLNCPRQFHFMIHGEDCRGGRMRAELLTFRGPRPRGKTGTVDQMAKHLLKAAAAVYYED